MKLKLAATAFLSAAALPSSHAIELAVPLGERGRAVMSVKDGGGWKYEFARSDDGSVPGLFTAKLRVSGPGGALPPPVRVEYAMEQVDVQYRWCQQCQRMAVPWLEYMGDFLSVSSGIAPVEAWVSKTDENRLTFSASDASRPVLFTGYEVDHPGSRLFTAVTFFSRGGAPFKSYEVSLRWDFRRVHFADSVADACDWTASFPGQSSPPVPEIAYEPLWNSWYGYHIGYTAADMEKEGDIAAALGIRTVMYDMGWDRCGSTNSTSFLACGDWRPDPVDFPDFKAHLASMHRKGLKTILWIGLPLIGGRTANFPKFKDMLLLDTPVTVGCHALDPRFPEVRAFLVDTVVRGLKEWDADGWKIDFFNTFRIYGKDRAAESPGGRDYLRVEEAAAALQEEISKRAREVKPDVMFEYMTAYGGILGQRASTQIRAGDCPGDPVWNRWQCANQRLVAGARAAAHSDMITWSRDEPPEVCAEQIIAVLHSVLQFGMRLTELTPDQRRVVAHWIRFSRARKNALVKGGFRPHGLVGCYPLIETWSGEESVFLFSQRGMAAKFPPGRRVFAVNGTGAAGLVAELAAPCRVRCFDMYGAAAGEREFGTPGPALLPVPRAGYAEIEWGAPPAKAPKIW
ncbi:MAG: alpha-galactosidase [Kiritimatiellae bacterium]|nr:alpha-galactosidase [Kiritimatiellia bacterium]